jgi:hypothetical protein
MTPAERALAVARLQADGYEVKKIGGFVRGAIGAARGAVDWDESLHPRDRRGRFIEKGGLVSFPGGRGRVEGNKADGRITVRRSDNNTLVDVDPGHVTVIGGAPDRLVRQQSGRDNLRPDRADGPQGPQEPRTRPASDRPRASDVLAYLRESPQEGGQEAWLERAPEAPDGMRGVITTPDPDDDEVLVFDDVDEWQRLVDDMGLSTADETLGKFDDGPAPAAPAPAPAPEGDASPATAPADFPTALDQRLVNYKPDRNLADPSQTQRLDEVLDDAEYEPYGLLPFIDDMHRQMGVDDPATVEVDEYMDARQALFDQQPVVDVDVSDGVVVTQPMVNAARVQEIRDYPERGGTKPLMLVRSGGKVYVMNGHHRVAANLLGGQTTLQGRLLDLDAGRQADAPPVAQRPPGAPDSGLDPNVPLSDKQYEEHARFVERKTAEVAAEAGLSGGGIAAYSQVRYTNANGVYTPQRRAQHDEIIREVLERAAAVPTQGRALFTGGLGGAGKSSVLKQHPDIDPSEYLTLNPDDVKELMAAKGMIPKVDGLSPMEASVLVHEEASDLTKRLATRAYEERRNVIWDITMGSEGSVRKRLAELRDAGYSDIQAVFVDIPADLSVQRALGRHRQGMEDRRKNPDAIGGRYVPPAVIRASADPTGQRKSKNRGVFDALVADGAFQHAEVWDTSGGSPSRTETFGNSSASDTLLRKEEAA